MLPVYKIETYTGVTLDYTITDKATFRIRKNLTGQPGNFSITIPGMIGDVKCYDDVAVFDKVKVYLGYDSIPASPLFVGRIENIQNRLIADQYVRTLSGKDQGEVTTRLQLHQYNTAGGQASTQVTNWATDCGLGTGQITADTTAVTIISNDSKYESLLREICDYAASISKDWYVDEDNNLVWKTRPLRTAGVSTLTVGTNIKEYSLTRDILEVYNKFYTFGASEPQKPGTSICSHDAYTKADTDIPSDHDLWTENTLTGWTSGSKCGLEEVLSDSSSPHAGTYYVLGSVALGEAQENEWLWISKAISPSLPIKDTAALDFALIYNSSSSTILDCHFDLLADDATDFFRYTLNSANYPNIWGAGWKHYHIPLGPAYEGSGNEKWTRQTTAANWYDLEGVKFYIQTQTAAAGMLQIKVDCLYFSGLRWWGLDEDATSQSNYGVRQMVVTNEKIHSNTDCANYAAMLKDRYKDVALQLDVIMPLDTNILIGDRIPITIANENLSAQNFDVIRVEHTNIGGYFTHATLTSRARQRALLKSTDPHTLWRDISEHGKYLADQTTIIK